MAPAPPSTWHVQDWLLAVEALASRTHPEEASAAAEHRWWLIETLCAGCGIDPTAYVFCIDDEWSGPPAESSPTADLEDRVDDAGDFGAGDASLDNADGGPTDANDEGGDASEWDGELLKRLDADDWATLAAALSAFAERGGSMPRTRRAAVLADSITPGTVSPTPTDDGESLQSDCS